jgi:hypothetical protein
MPDIAVDRPPSRASAVERYLAAVQQADAVALAELLAADVVTSWPQTGERISGAQACIRVYQEYPGGPPQCRIERVIGGGDVWIALLVADYGTERWYVTSICEFEGDRIARITDYFGPSMPAPEWRIEYVDRIE